MNKNREAIRYKKNDTVKLEITDLTAEGMGVGKIDGYALFVKDAVVGDVLDARIVKTKKNYGYARIERIVSPSAMRIPARCILARRCGGCQIQEMDPKGQLDFKQNKVRNNLIRIGGFDPAFIDEVMEPIIGMEDPWRYRNKAQYPIGTDKDGNPVAGFYAGRTHSIIPCTDCALAPSENSTILGIILEHMRRHDILPYDERDGSGTVRHVMIRKGFATGEIMVCLVIKQADVRSSYGSGSPEKGQNTGCMSSGKRVMGNDRAQSRRIGLKEQEESESYDRKDTETEYIRGQSELIGKLREVPGMKSVCVSINNDNTNVIMGTEIHTLFGSDRISDVLLGKKFEISPLSFYQINPVQVERLYGTAIEYAGLTGSEEVWDVCCGIGTISICMTEKAGRVHGLEIVPEAIEDAKRNAALNNVDNVDFICAAAEEYLPAYMDMITADVVVLDPPRKGMDEAALAAIADVAPEKIVYVSCDSATLARDLKYLTDRGYKLKKVRCTDMFSQTVHVETVVLLTQRKPDMSIEITMNEEDLELTRAEAKATYKEITDYVMNKYGLKVNNLYVAQVKREFGIIERENYNKGKEGHHIPQVTPEKREAIIDALRFYKMIV